MIQAAHTPHGKHIQLPLRNKKSRHRRWRSKQPEASKSRRKVRSVTECFSINLAAVKPVLPTLINWHPPAILVPPPASHMLYDKKIRALNERRQGDRKLSMEIQWGEVVSLDQRRKVLALRMEKRNKKTQVCRTLHQCAPGADGCVFQLPLCILMKKNSLKCYNSSFTLMLSICYVKTSFLT